VRIPAAFLLLALAAPAAAQQPAEKPPEKCAISGQVVKAGTGEPLKKAIVVLRKAEGREEPQALPTDASGRFQLKDIEPGRYRLWAARTGYVRQEFGAAKPGRQGTILALAPGQQVRDVEFKMLPAAVIAGRVFDEDGEPLAGARLMLLQPHFEQGKRQLQPMRYANSNDRGDYRFYGLAPGRYYVSATYSPIYALMMAGAMLGEPSARAQTQGDEGYAPTYYPGTTEESRATPVEVKTGVEIPGIDFNLLPVRTVRVRGRVVNEVGGELRDAWVTIHPRQSGFMYMGPENQAVLDKERGTFEFRSVAPGAYTVVAQWWNREHDKSFQDQVDVEAAAADVDGLLLTIGPGQELPGSLLVEGGRLGKKESSEAAGSARASTRSGGAALDASELRVSLRPPGQFMVWREASGQVKEDGTFRIQNVYRGEFQVSVWRLPDDIYLKSARLEGEDVLEKGLTVTGELLRGELEVVVSARGGRIEGSVEKDGLPFSGAFVALVPEERRRQRSELFKNTTTDQYGRFTLRGIAPGEYKLFAWEEIEPGAHRDPDFLRWFEDEGKAIRVEEGARLTVELPALPGEEPR
jgi:protocatechuate 3,4-dioxygenase beta subunit